MRLKTCFTIDIRSKSNLRLVLIKRFLLDTNYRVVVQYRLADSFRRKRALKLLGKLILVRIARVPGVEFNTKHPIGKGFSIQHAHDIVIGHGAIIKNNVTIYNGVTLGAKYEIDQANRVLIPNTNRYPTICENVTIFPGAKVIGNIEIGANSIIGANAVVLNSFEKGSIIAGNPAKKIGTLDEN